MFPWHRVLLMGLGVTESIPELGPLEVPVGLVAAGGGGGGGSREARPWWP